MTAETSRLAAVGQVGRRSARRLSGLTTQLERDRLGPPNLAEQKSRPFRQRRSERDARLPIPRAQQRFAQPLTLPLGGDQRIGRPRTVGLESANADANRKQRRSRNHRRPSRERRDTTDRPMCSRDFAAPNPSEGGWHRRLGFRTCGGRVARRPCGRRGESDRCLPPASRRLLPRRSLAGGGTG